MTPIDARGLKCPWPALRLLRAVREAGNAFDLVILADDPAAATELASLASARGWDLSGRENAFRVIGGGR